MTSPASWTTHLLPLQLRLARYAVGLNQQDLADRLGVTRQMVSHLETSGADIQIGTIDRWAQALGLTVAITPTRRTWLLTGAHGELVVPERLAQHAHVHGPDRARVIAALANYRPGAAIVLCGDDPGDLLPPADAALDAEGLAELPDRLARLAGKDRTAPDATGAVLILDLDAAAEPPWATIAGVLARARAAGWVVLSHSRQPVDNPSLTQNTHYLLHAEGENVTGADGSAWTLTETLLPATCGTATAQTVAVELRNRDLRQQAEPVGSTPGQVFLEVTDDELAAMEHPARRT